MLARPIRTNTDLFASAVGLALVLLALLACKSDEEKARDAKQAQARVQKNQQTQGAAAAIAALAAKKDEWAKLAPPDAPAQGGYVKGKLAVVYRRAAGVNEVLPNDVVGLAEIHARAPAEVQTVAQVDCFETPSGSYVTQDAEKKEIPAFKSECELTLIDITMPAVIQRKKFENSKFADQITNLNVFWADIKAKNKVVAPQPQAEIRAYLQGLPRK